MNDFHILNKYTLFTYNMNALVIVGESHLYKYRMEEHHCMGQLASIAKMSLNY